MKYELKKRLFEYFNQKQDKTPEEKVLLISLGKEMGTFDVASVERDDLRTKDFDVTDVTDEDMERIANKMYDSYLDCGFWEDLVEAAYDLDVKSLI